jgi:hypothetical protein
MRESSPQPLVEHKDKFVLQQSAASINEGTRLDPSH